MGKMNILKKAAAAIVAASMAFTCTGAVYADTTTATVAAADAVTVVLNGTPLSYPDAQPQIFNSRTYVPIRQTAEYLGLTIDWNSKTETLTFTRNGITIAHTMRSSIVYVNGVATTYDSPSINKNNRTLMPVRMLADAIDAEVEWDNATRTVTITTTTSGSASVSSCSASETVVQGGNEIVLTAVTSSNATKVKFENAVSGDELAETTDYSENSDGTKVFTAVYRAENSSSDSQVVQIKAVAGTDAGYTTASDASKTVAIVVSPGTSDDDDDDDDDDSYASEYMISCELEDSSVDKGDYAYITVVTTDDVEKVRVTSSIGDSTANATKYTEDDDEREFEVKYKMTSKGTVELYVYLYVDGEYEDDYETLTCKVSGSSSSNDDTLEIYDAECIQDKVYKGEDAHVWVKTSLDIVNIVIRDEDDDKVAKESYYSYQDDDEEWLVWDLSFEMESSSKEKYTIVASDDDGETVEETIRIQGKTYSKSDPCMLAVTQKTTSIQEGDDCKVVFKTTGVVTSVSIFDEDGDEIDTITNGSGSGSTRTFTYTLESVDDIDEIYEATGYDDDGDQDTIQFKLIGESNGTVEINDIDIADTTVSLDDEVEITVYTTTGVTKLWVEDSDGERVSKKMTKPTDSTSTEYEWELDFDPEEKGRQTYTVIASDDNDNTDEETFRITVTS